MNLSKIFLRKYQKQSLLFYSTQESTNIDHFRPLNLKNVKQAATARRRMQQLEVGPDRTKQMKTDQDWGNVWPGPRSFHPASVPLPLRQGYTKKGAPPPDKYANAELMKIPNFLHLTPPVIKRQCEILKQFCTPWPKQLDTDEKCDEYFPLTVCTSDYCHSSPTIRDPLARIVTVRFKLAALGFNERAKDKFLRLVGERYNKETDLVTIVTDRCPLRKQNYDYAMYLITALFHESWKVEPWESEKSEADMEYYNWENNASKRNIEAIFSKRAEDIPDINVYSEAVSNLMNEGENEYTISKYREAVRKILNV